VDAGALELNATTNGF